MSDVTREELDAKFETTEARLDARVTEVRGDIKVLINKVDTLTTTVGEARAESRTDQKNTRTTMIVTAIAVVIGIAAAVWQMQSGLLEAFQAGLSAVQTVSSPAKPDEVKK